MKCFWIFGHDWKNWSDLVQGYTDWGVSCIYQVRECSKCGKKVVKVTMRGRLI